MIKIDIAKDLKEVKISGLKEQVLNIIATWKVQISEQIEEFNIQFLSEENDKYFNDLKDLIGEFKELKDKGEISVLYFIADIILGTKSCGDIKILEEMHKEFIKMENGKNRYMKMAKKHYNNN